MAELIKANPVLKDSVFVLLSLKPTGVQCISHK